MTIQHVSCHIYTFSYADIHWLSSGDVFTESDHDCKEQAGNVKREHVDNSERTEDIDFRRLSISSSGSFHSTLESLEDTQASTLAYHTPTHPLHVHHN